MTINAGRLFDAFAEAGRAEQSAILAEVAKPQDARVPRSWTITDAAELIGRSVPWLRKNDPDCPTDSRGRRRYSLNRINSIREKLGSRYRKPDKFPATCLSVANFKGGVGKSTLTMHLAHRAAIRGLRVLVIDNDSQATTSSNLLNDMPDVLDYTEVATEYLLDSPTDFRKIVRPTYFDCVDLAPANLHLQDCELLLLNEAENNQATLGSPVFRLEQALVPLRHSYDLILIDCPPNLGILTINSLIASQGIIIPLPPAAPDIASFTMLSASLSTFFRQSEKQIDIAKIIVNNHSGSTAAQLQESRLRSLYGKYVATNTVYHSAEIEKSAARLSSIFHQERAIDSRDTYLRALDCMGSACDEIIDEVIANYGEAK